MPTSRPPLQSGGIVVRDAEGEPRVVAGVDDEGGSSLSLVSGGRTVYLRNSTEAPLDFDVVGVLLDMQARVTRLESLMRRVTDEYNS